MEKENRLYSISLGVASLQGGSVGVATALSPATCRPFQVFSPSFFVGLGLVPKLAESYDVYSVDQNLTAVPGRLFKADLSDYEQIANVINAISDLRIII